MGIFDPPPGQPQQPAPQAAPPIPAQQPAPNQWGQPPQQPPAWPPQAPPQQPPGAYPPAPQGYAPPAYGGMQTPQGYAPQVPPPGYGAPPQYGPPGGGYRSPFDSIQGAQVYGDKAPFWTEEDGGTHAVIFGEVRRFAARKGNVDTYSWECRIIRSTNPRMSPGVQRCKQEQASKEGADGRIKKLLTALGNGAAVDDRAYHASYSEQQPFFGTIMILDVNPGVSTKGAKFTNVAARHPSPEELRQLAADAQRVDPQWRPSALQAALLR